MKKLKVEVGNGFLRREGFLEGSLVTATKGVAVLIYFPDDNSLVVASLGTVTPIGYEEV